MHDTPAARKWRRLIAEQAESGLTIRAFAESRNLKAGTLAWWRSQLARQPDPADAPVFSTLTVTEAVDNGTVVLALDDRRAHFVIDHETDLALVRRVLEALA